MAGGGNVNALVAGSVHATSGAISIILTAGSVIWTSGLGRRNEDSSA